MRRTLDVSINPVSTFDVSEHTVGGPSCFREVFTAIEFGTAALLQAHTFADDVKTGALSRTCFRRGSDHMRAFIQHTPGNNGTTDAGAIGKLSCIADLVESMTGRGMWNNKHQVKYLLEPPELHRIKVLLQHSCVRPATSL